MPEMLLPSVDCVCTRMQLAKILGITSRRIDTLAAENVLKPVRLGSALKGKGFRLAESVANYQTYSRASLVKQYARGGDGEYEKARSRRMSALAEAQELELAIARGDMVRRARVLHVMTALLSTVKNHVLAIPSRCTRQVVGQRDVHKVRSVLDKACRDCLREASEFGPHSFDETSKNGSKKAAAAGKL
jgi:phage terminase Nu1 subunit (DNA packaging protein)